MLLFCVSFGQRWGGRGGGKGGEGLRPTRGGGVGALNIFGQVLLIQRIQLAFIFVCRITVSFTLCVCLFLEGGVVGLEDMRGAGGRG